MVIHVVFLQKFLAFCIILAIDLAFLLVQSVVLVELVLINKLGLLVSRLSVVMKLKLVQLPLVVKLNSLGNFFLHVFEHHTALDINFTQFLLSSDLKLVLFVRKLLVEAFHQNLLVLIIFYGVLVLQCLKLCLFLLDLLHVVLLDLLEALIFLLLHLSLVVLNVLMELLIVLVGLPLHMPLLVSSELFNRTLLLINRICRFKHLFILHFTLVLIQLDLAVVCLLDVCELKLVHLCLLLLLILEILFNTASNLLSLDFCVFPCEFFLLK